MKKILKKGVPPLAPLTEVVEAVARHQEAGYSPSTTNNITSPDQKVNPETSKNPEKSLDSGIKRSMSTDLTPQEETDLQNNENFASEIGNGLKFSKVTDQKTIDKLLCSAFFMPRNQGIQWGIHSGAKKHPETLRF